MKVAREKTGHVGLVVKQDTLQRGVEREATQMCTPSMKMKVIEGTLGNDEELQAWCLFEESEHEQWQNGDQQTRQTTFEES